MPRKTSTRFQQPLSAAAAMSFLKETRGMLTWTIKDLQQILLVTEAQALEAISAFGIQGYVKAVEGNPNEWMTTINGETVSGSKPPYFDREKVEIALSALKQRIKNVNADTRAPYRVVTAIAFGDFLSGRARVQAADVGIELATHGTRREERETKAEFIRHLRAREIKINLVPYETWMSGRSHRDVM